ncbi:uncharacterized protein [Macrobrachium rosenbergii]|uniref:uncharacterized protein isoform X2 n=1 Tax=Macrobrachium rosenbergii TaxID=79674 RepID=UPI0034D617A9
MAYKNDRVNSSTDNIFTLQLVLTTARVRVGVLPRESNLKVDIRRTPAETEPLSPIPSIHPCVSVCTRQKSCLWPGATIKPSPESGLNGIVERLAFSTNTFKALYDAILCHERRCHTQVEVTFLHRHQCPDCPQATKKWLFTASNPPTHIRPRSESLAVTRRAQYHRKLLPNIIDVIANMVQVHSSI